MSDYAEWFSYCPDSGKLKWAKNNRVARAGNEAGYKNKEGRLSVMLGYKQHRVESICWELHYGAEVQFGYVVHHIDGIRSNNAIQNLRLERKCPSTEIIDVFKYDHESGLVSYAYQYLNSGIPIQKDVAGWINHAGYVRLSVAKKEVFAHRFAYRVMTGHDVPKGKEIDHINGIRSDNRWCNLRLVDRTRNNMNAKVQVNNSCGIKGVYFDKRRELWVAEIKANHKKHFLGRFATMQEAAEARAKAESELFGEYSFANSRGNK